MNTSKVIGEKWFARFSQKLKKNEKS